MTNETHFSSELPEPKSPPRPRKSKSNDLHTTNNPNNLTSTNMPPISALSMYNDNLATLTLSPQVPKTSSSSSSSNNKNYNSTSIQGSPARPNWIGFDPLLSGGGAAPPPPAATAAGLNFDISRSSSSGGGGSDTGVAVPPHPLAHPLLSGPRPSTIANRSKSVPLAPVSMTSRKNNAPAPATTIAATITTKVRGHNRASSDLSKGTQEKIHITSRTRLQSADAAAVFSRSSKSPERNRSTRQTPPRPRKLANMFKGHRKTKSWEGGKELNVAPPVKKSAPNSPNSNHRTVSKSTTTATAAPTTTTTDATTPSSNTNSNASSMYPAIVQDLMNLKMNNLEIPSLAKPSPTSFLTGKEDEVVRTCETEPTPYQTEIPTLPEFLVTSRLNEFLHTYRMVDQNFDLQQLVGLSRMDLRQVKIPQHVPIAESILQCGDDVCIRGVCVSNNQVSTDERLEMVVFEGQRQFTAVFRGTTEQQAKPGGGKKKNNKAVPFDEVEVYNCFLDDYKKLEAECFALLDRLTDEEPFCDVVFSGYSFGAALATLAAFRYAHARPMMRASCLTFASPKVGFSSFRLLVNSLPNLKVMRVELGNDGKCAAPGTGGSHVGHTLLLSNKASKPVLAFKFETPKHRIIKKVTNPDLRAYVSALEELSNAKKGNGWINDFVGTAGEGVVVNNEARLVV